MRLFPLSNGFVNLDLVRRMVEMSGRDVIRLVLDYGDDEVTLQGEDALRLLDFLRHEAASSTAGYAGALAAIEDDGAGREPIVVAGGVPEF